MRLLFVENDPYVHRLLSAQANALSFELTFAHDDKVALELLDRTDTDEASPDAVLIDVSSGALPSHKSWALLRRRLDTRNIPWMVYSSSRYQLRVSFPSDVSGRCCRGFLASPFTLANVTAALCQKTQRPVRAGQAT